MTIQNVSSAAVDTRYRRVMDWDVPPTTFDEYVTNHTGGAPVVLDENDNGFTTANPLGSQTLGAPTCFTTGDVTNDGYGIGSAGSMRLPAAPPNPAPD